MSAGGAAAAIAAKNARILKEEEEEMTNYNESELNNQWEFKILRSVSGSFRNPEKTRQFLQEEAQSGWVLLEKFDNYRMRLKRKKDCKMINPSIDPYRIFVGISPGTYSVLIVISVILGSLAFYGIIAGLIRVIRSV